MKGVVQILHGIAEYVERYDDFACHLNRLGYVVVAEDHMGHGKSIQGGSTQGYFTGGWFTATEDCLTLLHLTRLEYPGVKYFLFGHSMGSFLCRTILARYPDLMLDGAIICGTGWMNGMVLTAGRTAANAVCKNKGDRYPSKTLNTMIFGGYNGKVEHPRTTHDWLSRDNRIVDAYVADPLCGFVPAAGLLRDMMLGMLYIQRKESLEAMPKELPVLFIAGGDDPVGGYGKGVREAAQKFCDVGMKRVSCKIYPMMRHEILNELNRGDVYNDVAAWLNAQQ